MLKRYQWVSLLHSRFFFGSSRNAPQRAKNGCVADYQKVAEKCFGSLIIPASLGILGIVKLN